ncbi:MAG TPA: hypothetical protein VK081_12325, partial [Planctomycetota bacterium]|nr:hypothetical protein [Planctomycetota bacterium]
DVADAMIARLIARHGRTVYAPVEARAAQALAAATGDSRALADVIERFPHSDAAGEAVRSLMDLAVAQGDLEAAARCYRAGRDREHVGPGLQRRLLEAARKRGNLPFAAALAARLRERHGSVVSDLPADGGRTYADAVAIELPPPPPPPPPVVAPTHRTLDLLPLVPGNRLQCVPVRPVAGFTAPASLPLCVLEGGTVLRAHLLEGEDPAAPAWTLDAPRLNAHAPLLACGELLLVVEQDRVRAVQLADGRVLWTRNAPDDRSFYGLGVHTGLLQVFSEHPAASDGGRLLGIEPLTGTIVHERVFSVHEASLSPVAAGGSLWSLRPEPDDRSRVWLEEIDPLSGATLHRVALDDQARELLGLDGHPTVHAALVRILSRLFVHDDLVVLAGDGASENPQRPPAIVALQRDGSVRWSWRGTPRRALVYLWHRGDVLALYEAGMQLGGQMWFLDLRNRGRELHRIGELQGSVHALTPQRGMHQDQQGPPALVLAAHSRSGWSLVCQALGGDKPRFRARLTGDGELGNPVAHPVFGADFVLVAVNMIGRDESFLHLFDIASAREQRLRLSGVQVSRVTAAGASVALETADGITILGNRGTPLR